MQASLSLIQETKESLMDKLKYEWAAIEARRHEGEVNADVSRAKKLAEYESRGLTIQEMGVCIGLKHQQIARLLRYERFLKILAPAGARINEWNFRAYYQHYADPAAMRMLSGKKNLKAKFQYEETIFRKIVDMLNQGVKLDIDGKSGKVKGEKDPDQKEVKEKPRLSKRDLFLKRKEVREAYRMIEEDVKGLIALMGANRSTFAPDMMSLRAKRLKRGFMQLQKALKGDVDAWVLEDLE